MDLIWVSSYCFVLWVSVEYTFEGSQISSLYDICSNNNKQSYLYFQKVY